MISLTFKIHTYIYTHMSFNNVITEFYSHLKSSNASAVFRIKSKLLTIVLQADGVGQSVSLTSSLVIHFLNHYILITSLFLLPGLSFPQIFIKPRCHLLRDFPSPLHLLLLLFTLFSLALYCCFFSSLLQWKLLLLI